MDDAGSLFKRIPFLTKLLELLLEIICIALVGEKPVAVTASKVHVVYVAIMGYMIVNLISILSYVMKTRLHKNINIVIAVSGAAMFIAAGACMIEAYNLHNVIFNYLLGPAVCAFINAAVYIVDAVFSFKESTD